jgi:hypothetical protein
LAAVADGSDRLLATINQQLGGQFTATPLASFRGFPTPSLVGVLGAVSPRKSFVKSWKGSNEFIVITGEHSHYLLGSPTVHPCSGHSWASCQALGTHHPANAIIERSYEPAAFFTTTELHHCAHREIHHRRDERCHIGPFEEFLCCRGCVFEQICWTASELTGLPCGADTRAQPPTPATVNEPAPAL